MLAAILIAIPIWVSAFFIVRASCWIMRRPTFDIDTISWHEVRDKILKERYAGVYYSMRDSFSPVIYRHRDPLPMSDRKKIGKLFPPWIRVEFQQVTYKGEITSLYGRGDNTIVAGNPVKVDLSNSPITMSWAKREEMTPETKAEIRLKDV